MNITTFEVITYCWMFLALIVHVLMFFIKAPFGRHTSDKWGVMINNKTGWVVMELPSLLIMSYFLYRYIINVDAFAWILFLIWIIHYLNRTFVYPYRIKSTPKKMPLFIIINAIIFNVINAGLNGYYLVEIAIPGQYDVNWITGSTFAPGLLLFFIGMYINWKSDNILINLRQPGETGYKIPHGFLFRYISSPNLFGEIIEWTGFAIMAWNLPALTFMIWTFANLIPRAKNHHDWYHQNFSDYPKDRKIVFPFIY